MKGEPSLELDDLSKELSVDDPSPEQKTIDNLEKQIKVIQKSKESAIRKQNLQLSKLQKKSD